MKRPNTKQVRAELQRRRIHEAEAMARSDAVSDARIVKAFDVLVDDSALRDFESSVERAAVGGRSDRSASTH